MTKILITEDDETIRTALAVILGDNGFCPITASSCEQALQLFDECDLCLLYLIAALPIALMLAFATGGSNISDDYKKLYDSGLFRIINTNTRFIDCFDKQGSRDKSFISDKLNSRDLGIRFATITQEKFKMLKSDISYDELVQKGGVLLCSKIYKLEKNSENWVEDGDALKTVPDKITIQLISGKKESGDLKTDELSFDVSGTYTLNPNVNEYGSESDIIAVVPMENFYKLFDRPEFTDDESIMTKYTNLYYSYTMKSLSVGLVAKDSKVNEAEQFLKDTFKERAFITSYVSQKQTLERSAKALRIAGMSLAAIVFAAAMMNVASTSATEMVNRRRERKTRTQVL